MSGCVLRVVGSKNKIRKFLDSSKLEPIKVYYKGELGFPKQRGLSKTSGFNLLLTSDKVDDSIEKQCGAAVSFLKKNRTEFKRLKKIGFQLAILDFGLRDKTTKNHPWPTYLISHAMVSIAGELGFAIEISLYGATDSLE